MALISRCDAWLRSGLASRESESASQARHFHAFFTAVETFSSRGGRTNTTHTPWRRKVMSLRDSRGCPVSARSAASLAQFEQALQLSVSYRLDPLATIQAALQADPDFAMGHCLRAGLMIMA